MGQFPFLCINRAFQRIVSEQAKAQVPPHAAGLDVHIQVKSSLSQQVLTHFNVKQMYAYIACCQKSFFFLCLVPPAKQACLGWTF